MSGLTVRSTAERGDPCDEHPSLSTLCRVQFGFPVQEYRVGSGHSSSRAAAAARP